MAKYNNNSKIYAHYEKTKAITLILKHILKNSWFKNKALLQSTLHRRILYGERIVMNE